MRIKKYISNCFLLLLPIFLWNILLYDDLPEAYSAAIFWNDIPHFISYSENILRIILFALPIIMVFSLKTRQQKIGFWIYCVGLLIYFASWMVLIISPSSNRSQSMIGFMAPAFTTIIFFVGIALIGNRSFFKIPYLTSIYIGLSILFILFHSAHTYIIFQRL